MDTAHPHKSTNVRLMTPGALTIAASRIALSALSATSPEVAARVATRLFLSPRRRPMRPHEAARLDGARRLDVRLAEGTIPVFIWEDRPDRPSRTVILVHGWESTAAQIASLVEPLTERGLRVVAFDGPGHGESTLEEGSVVHQARALASVAAALGPDPVHGVIGHSMGGAAALLATRFGFRAHRFAVLSAPLSPEGFVSGFSRVLQLSPDIQDRMRSRLEKKLEISTAELDTRRDAETIEEPVLVVHDRDDRIVPVEHGRSLAAACNDGSFLETSGLGHHRILRAPRVVDEVASFVGGPLRFSRTLDGELFMPALRAAS
jgi:pimeloyl-ACP methyl ester carboxylesterase